MCHWKSCATLMCGLVLALPARAQTTRCDSLTHGQDLTQGISAPTPTDDEHIQIGVNWGQATSTSPKEIDTRIPARSVVDLHVHHFNFLKFTVQYTVEEDSVASYRALDRLWSQIFLLGGMPASVRPDSAVGTEFDRKMIEWLDAMEDADKNLGNFLQGYGTPGLSHAQVMNVCAQIGEAEKEITQVDSSRAAARRVVMERLVLAEYQLFQSFLESHDQVVARQRAFIAAATKTAAGEHKTLPTRASGTIVTVSLIAKDQNQAQRGGQVALEYFVQSRLPLVFHTGLAFSGLDEVDFEQIRTLGGQEAWTQVKDSENSTDLTAFLTYPIHSFGRLGTTDVVIGPTIGTELSSPGKTIFAGATINLLGRFFLTGGLASSEITEGGTEITDRVGDELKTRELFDVITTRRQWAPYFSFSLSVID